MVTISWRAGVPGCVPAFGFPRRLIPLRRLRVGFSGLWLIRHLLRRLVRGLLRDLSGLLRGLFGLLRGLSGAAFPRSVRFLRLAVLARLGRLSRLACGWIGFRCPRGLTFSGRPALAWLRENAIVCALRP